jgi:hypothetical protein
MVLKGVGGCALGLPLLEGLVPRAARAQAAQARPYAVFLRQANGVAAAQTTELGAEPERFWPRATGPLTAEAVAGRALGELAGHLPRLLVVRGVNMADFAYGDGHARGALQGLTARGPVVANVGGASEADGESLDHRLGRELNPAGRDSLFLYAGQSGGWLGGPCISYRGSGVRRAAVHDPWAAYQQLVGGAGGLTPEAREALVVRQRSVNDLVREQLAALSRRPELSRADRERLDLHLASVRDVEVALSCRARADEEARLQALAPGYASTDGDQVLETARLHLEVAVLAIACGAQRSVALQVGSGNDGSTRYRDPDTGALMENFHYLSHRRQSHGGAEGAVIAGADLLHHKVDLQFARTFRHLLDRLAAYPMPDGRTLLEHGVSVWYNDNANGPGHSNRGVPFVLAGSCGGALRQGQCVQLPGTGPNHARLLNTLGAAVGLRNAAGGPLDSFGDPSLARAPLGELLA